jgi:hypothetical protein
MGKVHRFIAVQRNNRDSNGKELLQPRHRSKIVLVLALVLGSFLRRREGPLLVPSANCTKSRTRTTTTGTIERLEGKPALFGTPPQKTDDLPSFTFRVSCLWRHFLD